jgi:NADP-dependent 3-hydroxy acid dehydrogenase YdfG
MEEWTTHHCLPAVVATTPPQVEHQLQQQNHTMADTKLIVITGATGAQGGGVVNIMKRTPGWRVRAVTRNPDSDAAKQLTADGTVEVVRADYDDETSLLNAFSVTTSYPQRSPSPD